MRYFESELNFILEGATTNYRWSSEKPGLLINRMEYDPDTNSATIDGQDVEDMARSGATGLLIKIGKGIGAISGSRYDRTMIDTNTNKPVKDAFDAAIAIIASLRYTASLRKKLEQRGIPHQDIRKF